MRKSILFSVMAIAAAITVAVSASTFAVFTDSTTVTTNSLTAGNVTMDVNGDADGNASITFANGNPASCVAFNNMAFNDVCTIAYTVNNIGTLSFTVTTSDTPSPSVTGCYSFSNILDADDDTDDADVDPGQSADGLITVTLNRTGTTAPSNTDDDCEGATFSLSTLISVSQSLVGANGPHD